MADYQQKDFHTVTPYVYGRPGLLEFLTQVLGAKERFRGTGGGDAFHCEYTIGDSIVMLGIGKTTPPEFRAAAQWGVKPDSPEPPRSTLYVHVADVDAPYARALRAGAPSLAEPALQPWQDRMAGVRDAYGNTWWIATHQPARKWPAAFSARPLQAPRPDTGARSPRASASRTYR